MSDRFDFRSFAAEANSQSLSLEEVLRRRKRRQGSAAAGNDKKKKVKKILNKIAAVAEKAFEIYVLLKHRKDPIGIVLGAVSAYNVVSDLFEREPPQAVNWLRDMGAVKAFPMMCSFIYHTLRQMDVPSAKCWGNDADAESSDAEKIEEFDLGEGVKAWFVATDAGSDSVRDPHEGPYVLDPDEFIKRFATIVQEHLGDIVSINTFTKGWEEYYYLGAVSIPTDLYVSQFDEEELYRRVNELQDMGFNRTMLFYGPPGVGKTTLAARIARRMDGRLLVATSHVLDAGRGRTLLEGLIDIIDPSVVLFDDLDKMWRPNDMLESMERLNRKEGSRKRLLIGTVNTLGDIPEPMRRPGRFDEIIEFSNPSLEQRSAILDIYLKEFGVDLTDEEREQIAEVAGGMTGAYLQEVAKRAKVIGVDTLIDEIDQMKRICGLDDDEDEDDDEDDDEPEGSAVSSSQKDEEVLDTLVRALKSLAEGGGRKRPRGWHTTRMRRLRKEEAEETR